MMKSNYYLIVPIIYLYSGNVFATIELSDNILLSAFGSTSITKSDNATPLYLSREITNEHCFDCDTTLGVQFDAQFLNDFTSSIQVVKRPQDKWSAPALEWLYLGYNYDEYDIKIGRLRLPTFLDSEYYYVAHAFSAARPAQEVYTSLLGITYYDGINFIWQYELSDDISLSIEPHGTFFGDQSVTKGDFSYHFKLNRIYGLNIELNSYNYRVYINGVHTNYDFELYYAGSTSSIIKSQKGETLTMLSVGGEYLWQDLTFRGESYYSQDAFNWYTQITYTINNFTPYISYAEMNAVNTVKNESHTITTGLRFDFTPTISINLEYQKMNTDDYEASPFGKGQFTEPFYPSSEKDANVYTLMFNFIM